MSLKRRLHPDMNLNDLDYGITYQICQNFDVDRSWEALAASVGYATRHLHTLELELQRPNGSPTKRLLWDWGSRGATVRELYDKLALINRTQCMRLLQHIVCTDKADKDKEKKVCADQEDHTDLSTAGSLSSKSDNCLVSSTQDDMTYDIDSLPIPKLKKNQPKQSNMMDVNLNNRDEAQDKPSNKLALVDKKFDAILDNNGASSMEMLALADGPPVSHGNLGAASSAVRSFDRVRSVVDEYGPEAPYRPHISQGERDFAQVLLASPNYTYKELSGATGGFSATNKLGQGKFGAVYYGLVKNTKCAIKKLIQKDQSMDEDSSIHMSNELKTLTRYRHENIVSMYGYALDTDEVCLVYQYMPNRSLYDCLFRRSDLVLSWEQRISILRGAACGLQFLHSVDKTPVIHGDIKSANVLLDRHFEAKIGDLGLARSATGGEVSGQMTHVTQKTTGITDYKNRAYYAPEVIRGNSFSVKGDTYSFGVVMFECVTGSEAYDENRQTSPENRYLIEYLRDSMEECPKTNKQQMFEDKKLKIGFPEGVFNTVFELACNCTVDVKRKRPNMVEVYKELEKYETDYEYPAYYNMPDLSPKQNKNLEPKMAKHVDNSVHEHNMSMSSQGKPSAELNSPASLNPSKAVPQSPIDLLPKGEPLPEAFKLQQELDERNKNSKQDDYVNVDSLSAKIKASYISDPKKLQEMAKFDEENMPQPPPRSPIPASQYRTGEPRENTELINEKKDDSVKADGDESFEYELAVDPDKMAKLQEQSHVIAKQNQYENLTADGSKSQDETYKPYEFPNSGQDDTKTADCVNSTGQDASKIAGCLESVGQDTTKSIECPNPSAAGQDVPSVDYDTDSDDVFNNELELIAVKAKAKGGGLMMGIFDKYEEHKNEENIDFDNSDFTEEDEFDFNFDNEDSETSTITESVNNDFDMLNSGDIEDNELFESGDPPYVNVQKVVAEDKEDNLDKYQKKLKMYQSVAAETEDCEEFTERSSHSEHEIQNSARDNQTQGQGQSQGHSQGQSQGHSQVVNGCQGDHCNNRVKVVNIQDLIHKREPTECDEYV